MPFPLQPWNRPIWDLLDDTQQLHIVETQENTAKQLDISVVNQAEIQPNDVSY
jgi:hypothetical protein